MKRTLLGGRVRLSSPDAWPLLVSSVVPSRSFPLGTRIRAAADGTSFAVRCSSPVQICLVFSPGRRLLIFCWMQGSELFHRWLIFDLRYFSCVLSSYSLCYFRHNVRFHSFSCRVVGRHFTATVLSCPYKDLTSSRRFACPISGNIYM